MLQHRSRTWSLQNFPCLELGIRVGCQAFVRCSISGVRWEVLGFSYSGLVCGVVREGCGV